MPAWASPTTPSPRSPRPQPRGSTTATSPRSCMRRGIEERNLWGNSANARRRFERRESAVTPSAVVPAKAETHNHRPQLLRKASASVCLFRRPRRMGPRLRGTTSLVAADSEFSPPLLHAECDEAQLAVAVGDQQKHGFLAVLLQLVDALLDVGGIRHRFLRHLDDDVAGGEPLVGGIRGTVDAGDDDALDAVLDLVARTQILA